MVLCTACGTSENDEAVACSKCGAALATQAVVERTSRLTITSTVDEGRFIPGTLVAGRYRVIGLLGRGGMGEVYRATDLTLGQSVALKILPEEAAANERLLERFHNEVRVARQVSHPNVCRVYDIGEADGLPFLSMEYVDGEDLASLLQRIGRLPSDKALEIARKLCAGLAAAHERGVIHRDLKPQNIMLDKRGQVVIMDFGLAAVASTLRGPEARNGTPAYMSPEQLRGDSVSAKSDLYALGLIFYELFTGHRAYAANSVAELVSMQETARPVSMTSIASDVDPVVEKVIQRCLRPDPAERPATALAIAAALPGGDPLAAALAAGETPSPELVAASGKMEGFAARFAVPCLVFALLGVFAYPFAMKPLSSLPVTPMEFPPAVLEQKARDMAVGFGYAAKPVDWFSYLEWNRPLIKYLRSKPGARKDWKSLFASESPVIFNYRQSPDYLLAQPDGDVTMERPAPTSPGMLSMVLDSRGLLRSFSAVTTEREASPAGNQEFDARPIFRAAGLDMEQFQEASPRFTPTLAFDKRQAWRGVITGLPDTPVTIEVASWGGKLVSFAIRWPWDSDAANPRATSQILSDLFPALLATVCLLCGVYFARINLQRGRGDRKGAFRLAVFQYLLFTYMANITLHVVARTELVNFLVLNTGAALASAVILWTLYIALEPAVRSRWPQSLITWNRLVAGQFGDPRLGSHILLGAVIGIAMRYVFLWRQHYFVADGGSLDITDLAIITGFRGLSGNLVSRCWNSVLAGIAIFFLLSGLRVVVRRDWIAALVAAVLLTLQEGSLHASSHVLLDAPLYVGIYCVFGFALLRMGLVPAIVALFTVNVMGNIPLSGDFSAWYNPVAFFELALISGIAVYGFWRSQSSSAVLSSRC